MAFPYHREGTLRAPALALLWTGCMLYAIGSAGGGQIHELVAAGDIEAVATALQQAPELIDSRDDAGRTPLHVACRGGDDSLVRALVEAGSDVNAKDSYSSTPLHFLAYRNRSEAMVVLLERGAKADVTNHELKTPLHYAALADAGDAVGVLLSVGADLEIRDDYGRTALILGARERGGAAMMRALLTAGAKVNARDTFGADALELAAWRGKKDVVDVLLDAGARVPSAGPEANELLEEAASNALVRLFRALMTAGADPHMALPSGGTLVHAAAAGGSVKILEMLATIDTDLDAGDRFGWTPLHYAARDGRAGCARWLLDRGVGTNPRNAMGQTPLNVARDAGATDVIGVLVEAGADPAPMRFPELGGSYVGQRLPGAEPELFAPGIVSSIWGLHSSVTISPDGESIMWAPQVDMPGRIYSQGGILESRLTGGRWTAPAWAPFTDETDGDVPFFSPDGRRVYFIATRPPGGSSSVRERIWYADKKGSAWGPAKPVDDVVNDLPQHWQFSVDQQHALYFSTDLPSGLGHGDIYVSRFFDGAWTEPVGLGPPVNSAQDESTPFIAPDGSFLIFGRQGDLFISYRTKGGSWTEPVDLGGAINRKDTVELCPIVSPDGRLLFFLSTRGGTSHVWWVSASFIDRLRPDES